MHATAHASLLAQATALGIGGDLFRVLLERLGAGLLKALLDWMGKKGEAVPSALAANPALGLGNWLADLLERAGPQLIEQLVQQVVARGGLLGRLGAGLIRQFGNALLAELVALVRSLDGQRVLAEVFELGTGGAVPTPPAMPDVEPHKSEQV